MCVGAPLEGDDPHVRGLAAVGDGGLGAARAGQVARLREEAGVRQVGDVPAAHRAARAVLGAEHETLHIRPELSATTH